MSADDPTAEDVSERWPSAEAAVAIEEPVRTTDGGDATSESEFECEICQGTRDVRPTILDPVDEPIELAICDHCRQFYGVDSSDDTGAVTCFACDAGLSGDDRTIHMFEIEHPLAENVSVYSTTNGALCGDCAARLAWKMYQDRWPGHDTGGDA